MVFIGSVGKPCLRLFNIETTLVFCPPEQSSTLSHIQLFDYHLPIPRLTHQYCCSTINCNYHTNSMGITTRSSVDNASDLVNGRSVHAPLSLSMSTPPQDRSRDDPPSPPPQPPPSPAHWNRTVPVSSTVYRIVSCS